MSVGAWPWPRETVAMLVDRIAAAAPSVVAIDILFENADSHSPAALARQLGAASRTKRPHGAGRHPARRRQAPRRRPAEHRRRAWICARSRDARQHTCAADHRPRRRETCRHLARRRRHRPAGGADERRARTRRARAAGRCERHRPPRAAACRGGRPALSGPRPRVRPRPFRRLQLHHRRCDRDHSGGRPAVAARTQRHAAAFAGRRKGSRACRSSRPRTSCRAASIRPCSRSPWS